jgi:hypothetical protein
MSVWATPTKPRQIAPAPACCVIERDAHVANIFHAAQEWLANPCDVFHTTQRMFPNCGQACYHRRDLTLRRLPYEYRTAPSGPKSKEAGHVRIRCHACILWIF